MLISGMTPSRGRPQRLKEMAQSVWGTACDEIQIVAWLDDDDPTLPEYKTVCEELGIVYLVGPRNIIHSARWDKCLPACSGELLLHLNDDVIFRTDSWDEMVKQEFSKYPDHILMVHGDDLGCQRENFGCHPIVHRKWVETVGYFIPDCFDGEYGDAVVNFIANRIGRRVFLPFVQEHMHYLFGKAAVDQTTKDYLERHNKQNPSKIYQDRMQDWISAANRLKAVMEK